MYNTSYLLEGKIKMKKELNINNNDVVDLISIYEILKVPSLPNETEEKFINYNIIKQVIYTDASSYDIINKNIQSIDKYTLNDKVYKAHNKVTNSIKLNNYSYAIIYTIAKEHARINNIGGYFDIVKKIDINLSNPKDRKTLKNVKKVIKSNSSNNVNFNSVLEFTLSSLLVKDNNFKQNGNVYLLNK